MNTCTLWQALGLMATCVSLSAQRTWIVSNYAGYPGYDFPNLAQAVAAASPGDTIQLVMSPHGPNVPFDGARIDKALHVIGCASDSAIPPGPGAPANGVSVSGLLDVSGVRAGETLTMSNISMFARWSLSVPFVFPDGIRVADCPGRVVLENVSLTGNGFFQFQFALERCADVVLHNVDSYAGADGMRIIDSSVVMSYSSFHGLSPIRIMPYAQPPYATVTPPPTIEILNSHVLTWDTYIEGTYGWNRSSWSSYDVQATHAAWVRSGTLDIGPAAWLIGGLNTWWWTNLPGAQIEPGAVVRKDPRGVCYGNTVPPTTIHTIGHPTLIQDYGYTVRTFGPPNGFAFLGVGDWAASPTPLGFGDLWINLRSLSIIGLAPLDGIYGEYTYDLFCPRNVPEGFVYAFQAAMIAPNGDLAMTPPSPFTVAWAFGRL